MCPYQRHHFIPVRGDVTTCLLVQVLDEMQRDLRRRTEEEIAHLQDIVFRDNDDAFFRECDADRLKRQLRQTQLKSTPILA